MHFILDENHEPVEIVVFDEDTGVFDSAALQRWGEWYKCFDNRRVALTTVGPYTVSTVFLGLNHEYTGDRAPILFETLVRDAELEGFNGRPGFSDLQMRYNTWAEAEAGHALVVAFCEGSLAESDVPERETP